jgi:hypothetical protein
VTTLSQEGVAAGFDVEFAELEDPEVEPDAEDDDDVDEDVLDDESAEDEPEDVSDFFSAGFEAPEGLSRESVR